MRKITIKETVILTIFSVIIFICKISFAALPNIELVTFFLIIFTALLGLKIIYTSIIYVLLEIMYYGLGIWTVGYIFLWPFLVLLVCLFRRRMKESNFYRSLLSGMFGFGFDIFYAVMTGLLSGFGSGVIYFLSGIVFSTVHMVSNYFIMLLLGEQVYQLVKRCLSQYFSGG